MPELDQWFIDRVPAFFFYNRIPIPSTMGGWKLVKRLRVWPSRNAVRASEGCNICLPIVICWAVVRCVITVTVAILAQGTPSGWSDSLAFLPLNPLEVRTHLGYVFSFPISFGCGGGWGKRIGPPLLLRGIEERWVKRSSRMAASD